MAFAAVREGDGSMKYVLPSSNQVSVCTRQVDTSPLIPLSSWPGARLKMLDLFVPWFATDMKASEWLFSLVPLRCVA